VTLIEIESAETEKPLPKRWRWVQLGQVCEIIAGQSPPGSTYFREPVGLPFFQGKMDFGKLNPTTRTWCSKPIKISQPGDILISVRAPVGPTNVADAKCCIGRGLAAIRCSDKVNKDYILWALKLFELDISKMGSGSTFTSINIPELKKFEIPLPSLTEQQRIAKRLNEQMASIEKARAAVDARLEAAQALPAAYLREVFPQRGQELPKGWRWSQLKDVCKQDKNIIDFKDERRNNLDFIGLENIESGTGKFNLIPKLKLASNSTTFFFDSRHILYGKLRPYLNKVALPNFKGQCTTELVPLLVAKEINRDFIAWIIRREDTIEAVMKEKTGSRMPRADMDILLSVVFPIPISYVEQERIITLLNSRIAKTQNIIQKTQQELDIINTLPAALLGQAFSGGL
jgi:type I restriction enzyme, S subunit